MSLLLSTGTKHQKGINRPHPPAREEKKRKEVRESSLEPAQAEGKHEPETRFSPIREKKRRRHPSRV